VKHGFAFPGESFSDFETDNILITPGNFSIGGGFKLDKPKFHKGNIPADYIFSPGDLVVTMTDLSKAADTLGYGARIPYVEGKRLLHNQRVGKVILKPGAKTTLEFLHWVLRTTEYRNEMIATASGSTVKHTAPSRIEAFKFRLPPLPIQKAIAHVLGTLDDRIELCRRMNETLEAMARALFKDWFIDFGPVRAKMEGREPPGLSPEIAALFPDNLVDSELGEIPEGWNVTRFQDIIELNPSESLKKGVVAPYLDMAALPTTGSCADSAVPREFGSGMKFRNGDTLMARITPCLENGKTAFVQHLPIGKVAWGSTEFVVMRPKHPVPAPFVYLMARDESFRECAIRSMTGTSGRQRAQASSLADYKFVNPQRPVWEAFGAATSVSFEKIKSNATRIEALVQTRDALLPKLLSGELTIPEAMLQVAAA
jgi:type I restriction enzyme S subunit